MTTRKPRRGAREVGRFVRNGVHLARLMKLRGQARETLCLANMAIATLEPASPLRAMRVREFDEAMVRVHCGKWWSTIGLRTGERAAWRRAHEQFVSATTLARELLKRLREGDPEPVAFEATPVHADGAEIPFAGEVPLVPEITPIVFLQGSDHQMGAQYAHQLVEIFGRWILDRHTGTRFSEAERAELRRWEGVHAEHTPWLLDFCRGWADAAVEHGIPMTYDQVLDLWVGHKPPAADYLGGGAMPDLPALACSGLAAWGSATADGLLVTGSTGDHDLSYQVTIVGFPEHGNRFIYSPFGATGEIAGGGPMWFFGHPAMNERGLAYVHHGGGPKFLEPRSEWGYGVRRAAAVIHILRTCDTARQARRAELSFPIGDVGWGDQATAGGFWADGETAHVMESRRSPEAIRQAGMLGERDFLYANNSVAHPRAIEAEWLAKDASTWRWDEHGGWTPKEPRGMTKSLGLMLGWATGRLSTSDLLRRGMIFAYANSCARNRTAFRLLDAAHGHLDVEGMKAIYRTGGTIPEGPWRQLEKEYVRSGTWGEVSVAHCSNAMTVVTKPSEGLYCLCTGPARRGMAPMMPTSNISIRAETNAFWELRLGAHPEDVMEAARTVAMRNLLRARDALSARAGEPEVDRAWSRLFDEAAAQFSAGEADRAARTVDELARATRAYTRAQVRALQVADALGVPGSRRPSLHEEGAVSASGA